MDLGLTQGYELSVDVEVLAVNVLVRFQTEEIPLVVDIVGQSVLEDELKGARDYVYEVELCQWIPARHGLNGEVRLNDHLFCDVVAEGGSEDFVEGKVAEDLCDFVLRNQVYVDSRAERHDWTTC